MREAIERVVADPGVEWVGLARGVSAIDVVCMAAEVCGADMVTLSTMGLGMDDARRLAAIGCEVRVVASRSLQTMQRSLKDETVDALPGLMMAETHAKFAVFRFGSRRLVMLTSANLTRNVRWESYQFMCDESLADVLEAHVAELAELGAEVGHDAGYYRRTANTAMGGRIEVDPGLGDLVERMGW